MQNDEVDEIEDLSHDDTLKERMCLNDEYDNDDMINYFCFKISRTLIIIARSCLLRKERMCRVRLSTMNMTMMI